MNHGLMTKTSLYLFSLLLLSTALYSETADEILQKMDDHNKITNSFEMIIRVENYKNNELDDTTLMKGTMKDGKVAAIDYLEPSSMKRTEDCCQR